MESRKDPASLDLTSCDREPIHAPSAIQPFGALLVIQDEFIVSASENCGRILGIATDELLNRHYTAAFGANCESLLEAVKRRDEPTAPTMVRLAGSKRWVTATAFRQANRVIVECERIDNDEVQDIASLKFVSQKHETVLSYLAFVAEGLRLITKFDRVMIYRFAEDWHGEVIAESKTMRLSSFYGHHFPATDIPQPARRLFLANWVRMIPDISYEPVPIKSIGEAPPLDLTLSALRSVSPIHIQYLTNMEISATLTLSIICDGRLWGLIACHNITPKYLPAHERSVCGLIAKMVSSRVTAIEVATIIEAREKLGVFVRSIQAEMATGVDLSELIRLHKHSLWKMIESDGFNFIAVDDENSTSDGQALEPTQAQELIKALEKSSVTVLHVINVQKEFPVWTDSPYFGGIIAVRAGHDWLVWNKKESVRTVTWAGDPNKAEATPGALLTPRASFADWQEQLRGYSTSWQQHEIDFAEQLYQIIFAGIESSTVNVEQPAQYLAKLNTLIEEDLDDLQGHVSL